MNEEIKCSDCKWAKNIQDSDGYWLSFCVLGANGDNPHYGERVDDRVEFDGCKHGREK